jgi:hypothetical protein
VKKGTYEKQGDRYTKIILWIFLAAVAAYFGYYIVTAVSQPLTTVVAMEYEAGTGSYTTGFVVRDESVVSSDYSITNLIVAEGERVAKDQTVATGYLTEDAQIRQEQIRELELQLQQLEYAISYSADASDQARLDAEIQSRLLDLTKYLARGDMNSAADLSTGLKGLVLRRSTSAEGDTAMQLSISALKEQLAQLQVGNRDEAMQVYAQHSGYFSGTVDGYESVLTVDLLEDLTVSRLDELTSRETSVRAVGKIILGDTWYYVTDVPADQAASVRKGARVPVSFAGHFLEDLEMTVQRIGTPENGRCLLVLSCDRYMQEVTLLRQQSADVIFTSYTGLRVPKNAIRVVDQKPGVYVAEGKTAAWKRVEILYDNGESYVVALDKSSTDNLWPGDEIIVGGRNLFDGKVVR